MWYLGAFFALSGLALALRYLVFGKRSESSWAAFGGVLLLAGGTYLFAAQCYDGIAPPLSWKGSNAPVITVRPLPNHPKTRTVRTNRLLSKNGFPIPPLS